MIERCKKCGRMGEVRFWAAGLCPEGNSDCSLEKAKDYKDTTPRTDAYLRSIGVTEPMQLIGLERMIADFARQLEHELLGRRKRVSDLKPGDTFRASGYGLVTFEGWDIYMGQTTAKLKLLEYSPGDHRYPFPSDLQSRMDAAGLE